MCAIFANMRNSDKYHWMKDISIGVIRQSLLSLNNAFQKFFSKITRYPVYKTKKRSKKSFTTRSERTRVKGNCISISGLNDMLVNAKNHPIPEGVRLYNTTITFDGYDYWFSCQIEKPKIDMSDIPKSEPVGIDVGIRNMITTSDGEYYHFSDTSKYEKRLKRQQRRLSKDYNLYFKESIRTKTKYEDVPKSKNHFKRLAKQHKSYAKITNKRNNDLNTATKRIVDKNPEAIVIENISVKDIIHNEPWMKKYAPQMVFYEIHRQLKYKAADRNIPVIIADRDYPSSKRCSACGFVNNNFSKQHVFICPICGFRADRDYNAAINLKQLAYQL